MNVKLLQNLMQHTRQFYNYTNVPIFVGKDIELNELRSFYEFLSKELKTTQYLFTPDIQDEDWSLLRNYIMDDIVGIVVCKLDDDTIWPVVDRRLRKLRKAKIIVIAAIEKLRINQIYKIVKKLWDLQFLQTILIANNYTYSYTPYPTIRFFNTSITEGANPFPAVSKDLMGYKIYTPVHNDIPRIFCSTNADKTLRFGGFAYQIFVHFLKRLNATLHITNLNIKRYITSSVNMSDILFHIGKREIEISTHPYTGIPEDQGIIGYPIFKARNCLIVPVQNEIPRYMYLIRPYDWTAWVAILITTICITIALISINYHNEPDRVNCLERLSRCFLESLSFVTFRPPLIKVHLPQLGILIVYIELSLLGFLITTLYSNLLSSFLTTFLVGHQIDTFEDIISIKFPIMAKYYEKLFLTQQVPDQLVSKFERLLVLVNASVQVSHLISFNRSFSYPVTEERWVFLALQQQYANKPIYRYSNICFGSPCVGYPMRLDSHLEQRMTQFIMDVQMAGLDKYWFVSDFNDALKAGYMQLIENEMPFKALNLDSMRVAFFIWIGGSIVSLVAFLGEMFLYYLYVHTIREPFHHNSVANHTTEFHLATQAQFSGEIGIQPLS